jgi:hypothetical protein
MLLNAFFFFHRTRWFRHYLFWLSLPVVKSSLHGLMSLHVGMTSMLGDDATTCLVSTCCDDGKILRCHHCLLWWCQKICYDGVPTGCHDVTTCCDDDTICCDDVTTCCVTSVLAVMVSLHVVMVTKLRDYVSACCDDATFYCDDVSIHVAMT